MQTLDKHDLTILCALRQSNDLHWQNMPCRALPSMEDFVLRKQIYGGRTSLVYHAVDRQSGISVALKLYQRAKMNDFERYQVAREITLHSQLHHKSIVMMYASWKDADFIYLALEWASGGDLYDYLLKSGGRLTEEVAVPVVLAATMSAFKHLHDKGIIHRDIKPENILMTKSSEVKIADFGLSISDQNEVANTRLGSLLYIAPEVLECPTKKHPLENKDRLDVCYTKKVDCWGIGVLAYEILVGMTPFNGGSIPEIVNQIRTKAIEFPSHLSPGAIDFITLALERDADKRPKIEHLMKHPWIRSFRKKRANLGMTVMSTSIPRYSNTVVAPAQSEPLPENAAAASSQSVISTGVAGSSLPGQLLRKHSNSISMPLPQSSSSPRQSAEKDPKSSPSGWQQDAGGLILTQPDCEASVSIVPKPPSAVRSAANSPHSPRAAAAGRPSSVKPACLMADPSHGTVLPKLLKVASASASTTAHSQPSSGMYEPRKRFSLRYWLGQKVEK